MFFFLFLFATIYAKLDWVIVCLVVFYLRFSRINIIPKGKMRRDSGAATALGLGTRESKLFDFQKLYNLVRKSRLKCLLKLLVFRLVFFSNCQPSFLNVFSPYLGSLASTGRSLDVPLARTSLIEGIHISKWKKFSCFSALRPLSFYPFSSLTYVMSIDTNHDSRLIARFFGAL